MSLSKWLPCDFEQCHPLLWSGGILVDHWSTISSSSCCFVDYTLGTLRLRQNGRYFADDICKCISWMKMYEFRLRFNGSLFLRVQSTIFHHYTPRTTKLLGGILVSLRPSVRLSVRLSVRPSRMPCPLCIIYSYGWILFILGTNDHYHERVCRAPWPLTLTYIFKVIRPWLRKSCPLCSIYSSGWILSIFGTNDHYH